MVEYVNQLNQNCQKCPELVKSRKRITWGYGNIKSPVIFIGEAPGYLGCDITGIPFKGDKSGDLFEEMLSTIELTLEDIYTTNIVKCCPPGNRTPTPNEIRNCKPYLYQEIEFISPKLVVPMGRTAIQVFYPYISSVLSVWNRQLTLSLGQLLLLPHPAYICRKYQERDKYIDSFRKIKELTRI